MTIDEVEKIITVIENKDYIVQLVNTVAKTLIEVFENLTIEDAYMFQLGYNKAIDDYTEKAKAECKVHYVDCDPYFGGIKDSILYEDDIEEIAEQLKAGDRECTEKIKFQRE